MVLGFVGLLAGGQSLVAGCSVFVQAATQQCQNDGDCARFTGTYCGPQQTCLPLESYCTSNAQCLDRFGDNHHICRKSADGKANACVDLFSNECFSLYSDDDGVELLRDDNTIIIGGVLFASLDPAFLAGEQSVDLARRQINSLGGLTSPTPGAPPRKFAFLSCSPSNALPLPEIAATAAKHLVNDVGVPAIIGPEIGPMIASVVTEVAIPTKTVVITQGQGSTLLNTLPGRQGVLFRIAALDDVDMVMRSWLVTNYAKATLVQQGKVQASDKLKVLLLRENGAYGDSGHDLAQQLLQFNGETLSQNSADGNFEEINYGDPASANFASTESAAIASTLAFQPHVILVWGNQQTFEMNKAIEEQWTGAIKPFYIHGVPFVQPVFSQYVTGNADRRARFIGIELDPPVSDPTVQDYSQSFFSEFLSTTATLSSVGEGTYDAMYMIYYGMAALGAKPLTGANLGPSILTSVEDPKGTVITPGQSQIAAALAALQAGNHIKYKGVIGPMLFNQQGDVLGWDSVICVSNNRATVHTAGDAQVGVFFDPNQNKITGTFNCPPEGM